MSPALLSPGENDLTNSDELWRLLCTMIRFKSEDHIRQENADKQDGGQVRGESIFVKPGGQQDSPNAIRRQSEEWRTRLQRFTPMPVDQFVFLSRQSFPGYIDWSRM